MEESTATLSAPAPSQPHTRSSSRAPSAPRREETSDSEKAGRVWARGVDDPWHPCILTLDGGGIRGYSSLMILKALMHEVWIWEQYYDRETVTVRTDSPTELHSSFEQDEEQAEAGALRGRSGHHRTLGNDPDQGHEQHGIETELGQIATAPAAARETLLQDALTADLSTRKAASEAELLPCHYFDFMYGTSTGGLIATILGRLRMTVTEGLELYRKVGDDLFGKRRSKIPLMTKYYHEPFEKAVRDIVSSRCHEHPNCDGNDLHPWDSSNPIQEPFDVDKPRVCQQCCLSATHDENISEAYLLRSYAHYYSEDAPNWITRYNEGADPIPIWTVTRATTAAPFYFEMVEAIVADQQKSFKDGGIRENNPSGAALSEFHSLYEGKAADPALMLSVGTGRPNTKNDGFRSSAPWSIPFVNKFLEKRAVIQNLLIKYTEGEKQHKNMREYAHGEHTWYKRLNVSKGFEDMPLDEWQRGIWTDPNTGEERTVAGGASLTKMEEATEEYLNRPFDPEIDSYAPPMTMLKQAAQKLVLQRRAREELGGERWDVFVGKNLHGRKVNAEVDADGRNGHVG
ncbi:uncharacterized protein CLAFUR5_09268 [Fulvia fulva]|uniref:PNPLA domain-containing protein n=1 Tax=Passalora fulva TaxID=5499 RepID=A0A9Q8PFG2_PASFU|nr:uncharacterized protein CLAFUR5_09268 [Fulvia fulva]UJO21508.1 hypothetical protein CLAFUR5_09268 [Fulvia fulva]